MEMKCFVIEFPVSGENENYDLEQIVSCWCDNDLNALKLCPDVQYIFFPIPYQDVHYSV